jgi:UDP-N-acetyl-D-galactosamine dehydrogenase
MILAGRRLNDGMAQYIVSQLVKAMLKKCIQVEQANVLVMGLTFKENCPDLRNTKVIDIVTELKDYNVNVDIVDPLCSNQEALEEYNLALIPEPKINTYDAIIIAVAHEQFKLLGIDGIKAFGKENHVLFDLKSILDKDSVDLRL